MRILIVDDDRDIGTKFMEFLLSKGYDVEYVDNGKTAIDKLKGANFDLVLLDIMMPGMDGIEVLETIKKMDPEKTVVMITGAKTFDLVRKSLQLGAFDYIVKPFDKNDIEFMLQRVKERLNILQIKRDYQRFLEEKVQEQTLKIKQLFLGSITSLIKIIEAKDPYHRDHSENVGRISYEIGKLMGLYRKELDNLSYAGLLHDIGKVGVPDRILLKNGKLSTEEYEIIKRHPVIGFEILKPFIDNREILDGVLHHHERYNGNGFPNGLKGEKIPLFGRIIGVADAIEAMTSERPYRAKLTEYEVIQELDKNRGAQFDPEIAEYGIKLLEVKNG